ncbi:ATP-grasp domain-containing protein [Singulisphaera rosea]
MTLLILGASTRSAAFSAIRAGLTPSCVDLFADRDLLAVCPASRIEPEFYPDHFVSLADELPNSPWMYTGSLENSPDLVATISARRTLWGNGAETLRAVRDPFQVAAAVQRAGLACPEVRSSAWGLPPDGRWLVKPFASGGGFGIVPLEPGYRAPLRPFYYQEHIPGPSFSAIFLGERTEAKLVGVTRQLIGVPGASFAYRGSLGPWPVSSEASHRLGELGTVLVRSFGLLGLFGVDFILRDDYPWPVEVNPRYTASVEILEYALGRSLLADHARIFDREVLRPPDSEKRNFPRLVGKQILFASTPCIFPANEERTGVLRSPFEFPRIADIPEAGTRFGTGEPVLTLFATGRDATACQRRLGRLSAFWEGRLRPG